METNRIIRLAQSSDRLTWDNLAGHPLQSWAWGEFRQKIATDVVRLVAKQNGKLTAIWQLTFHSLPFLPWTIGYFPKGPLPDKEVIKELVKVGKQKQAIFIQIEPNIQNVSPITDRVSRLLKPAHHPLFTKYTFVFDLTKSEDELLRTMQPKTRYNIRLAQKHGVAIKEDNSPLAFQEYLRLSRETTGRQGFYAHDEKYHQRMWEVMHKAGIAHLFIATYQGSTLAAWIVFAWKNTIYYPYGASSRQHREVMAPNLLLWEIARWGKQQGFKYFDLWGALGPNPDPGDPWFGFHRFKQGYSPQLVEFVGSYDLVINPPLYTLYKVADSVRWAILRLKRRL